jgi:hypothetical protein
LEKAKTKAKTEEEPKLGPVKDQIFLQEKKPSGFENSTPNNKASGRTVMRPYDAMAVFRL